MAWQCSVIVEVVIVFTLKRASRGLVRGSSLSHVELSMLREREDGRASSY